MDINIFNQIYQRYLCFTGIYQQQLMEKEQNINLYKYCLGDQGQVVPDDLRKQVENPNVYPYSGIGNVQAQFQYIQNGQLKIMQKYSTGVLVGKNLVLTCANLLISRNTQKIQIIANKITFTPSFLIQNKDNKIDETKCRIKAKQTYFPELYMDEDIKKNRQQAKYDFCLLKLQKNDFLKEQMVIKTNFNFNFRIDQLEKEPILLCGISNARRQQDLQFLYEQNLLQRQIRNFVYYKHTTKQGYSGAPLLAKNKQNIYQLIGIHKGTIVNHNFGPLLSSIKSTQLNAYKYIINQGNQQWWLQKVNNIKIKSLDQLLYNRVQKTKFLQENKKKLQKQILNVESSITQNSQQMLIIIQQVKSLKIINVKNENKQQNDNNYLLIQKMINKNKEKDLYKYNQGDQDKKTKEDQRKKISQKQTKQTPYNILGKVISNMNIQGKNYSFKSYSKQGTGCFIHPCIILTVAHNIFFKEINRLAYQNQILFYPSVSCQNEAFKPEKAIKIIKKWINPNYLDSTHQFDQKFDIAFLQIQPCQQFRQIKPLKLNLHYNYKDHKKQIIKITGYSDEILNQNVLLTQERVASEQRNQFLMYMHTTFGGTSGAPLLLKNQNEQNKYQIVGIHKGTNAFKNYGIVLSGYNKQQFSDLYTPSYKRLLEENRQLKKNL